MISVCCDNQFWLVVAGFVIAFVLAFGIGANDVANSFGTSVGSKVLTLKQACILATIFEILGSILIGAKVSATIRKGILDPAIFSSHEEELMLGYVSALSGCCIWLIIATVLNLPVSGTHSIVGATIGMAIVSKGFKVIKWFEVLRIVCSWFISPLLSGVVSMVMFIMIRKYILRAKNPLESGLKFLPIIYTITIFINLGGVMESSPPLLGLDQVPFWGKLLMISGISILVYLGIWLVLCPHMKKKVEKIIANFNADQMFLQEEEEKSNYYNSDALKQTIATQVDYVELIVSRNNEEWRYQEKPKEIEMKAVVPKEVVNDDFETDVKPSKRNYIYSHSHSVSNSNNPLTISMSQRNRMRLDSAPSVYKEMQDYGDVNLTLGGYLHKVHSPATRTKSHNQKFQNSNLYRQYSTGSNRSSVPMLNKMFLQNNDELANGENKDFLSPFETNKNEDLVGLKQSEKKSGRFTSVPASIETQAVPDKAKLKEIAELDAVVEEDISEIFKKEKKVFVDDFAHSDPPEAAKLFSFLQILTAIFGSFAHGGNDVSNAIGPLIGLYLIYQEGEIKNEQLTPSWILFYGGVGISMGLWILGRRVIKTIGEDLTQITASSGFVIELASAITVLGASLIHIPVSTTHCKVGSVVFTGRVRSKESVDWSLFRNIIIAWIVTVPVAGSIAAAVQLMLKVAYGLPL